MYIIMAWCFVLCNIGITEVLHMPGCIYMYYALNLSSLRGNRQMIVKTPLGYDTQFLLFYHKLFFPQS